MSAEDGAAPWDDGAARLIDGAPMAGDGLENSIRPLALEEFVGQRKLRENLRVFIDAARTRGDDASADKLTRWVVAACDDILDQVRLSRRFGHDDRD